MKQIYVWDYFIRFFHWSLVVLFTLNHFILDEESILHNFAGYIITGLLILRFFWGIIGTKYARFSSFPPSMSAAKAQFRDILHFKGSHHIGHTPLGALMIYNLMISLMLACLAGIAMTYGGMKDVKWVEALHEFFANWALLSVFIHIFGVLLESFLTRTNLVRAMIKGYKNYKE